MRTEQFVLFTRRKNTFRIAWQFGDLFVPLHN